MLDLDEIAGVLPSQAGGSNDAAEHAYAGRDERDDLVPGHRPGSSTVAGCAALLRSSAFTAARIACSRRNRPAACSFVIWASDPFSAMRPAPQSGKSTI